MREQRTYRCRGELAAWRYEWMKKWNMDDLVTGGKTDGEDADFTFTATHRMNVPGSSVGLARVNERFNVTLPPDMDAFYRRWDGGILLFREIYPLLSVEQMLAVNDYFIGFSGWDRGKPWPLIRFCDMSNADYLGVKLFADGNWRVIFMSMEYPDGSFIDAWDREHQGALLDSSFTRWLKRMVSTDGWPVGGASLYEADIIPPSHRIG